MSATSSEDIIETMADENMPNYGSTSDTNCLVEEGVNQRRPNWYHGFLTRSRRFFSNKERGPDENPEGSLSTLNGVTIPTCLSMFRYLRFNFVVYKSS